jgi:DNA-binding PadR family transcriptional regulator
MRIVYRLTQKGAATFRDVFGEETIEGSETNRWFEYAFAIPEENIHGLVDWGACLSAFAKGKQSSQVISRRRSNFCRRS